MACFDPPLEVVPPKNPSMYNKKAADPVRPDLASLLVKNTNLLAELRNLQNKLFIKETSLQEMKSELESYKENNVQQSFQIMSLKDDIKDLQELIASLTRIKSLKNTNIQSLERGNWDLTERILELENRLRVHLVEREKAERKADLLEKKLVGANKFIPYMNVKGQEDSLDSFKMKDKDEAILAKNFEKDIFHSEGPKDGQKIWDKYEQDLIHKEKQKYELDRPPYLFSWETKTVQSQYQKFLGQLASLLSNSVVPVPATEEAVKERIREIGANEQSWKSRTEGLQQEIQMLTQRLEQLHQHCEDAAQESSQTEEKCKEQKKSLKHLEGKIALKDFFQGRFDLDRKKENSRTKNSQTDEYGKMFKQLEKDKQQILLNIQQNLQIATTQRLEEKIQKLQKQLSDLKLSNKNMKTQLTRVNVLKDKTIEKLRQSLTQVEAMQGKAVMKTDKLKPTLDSAEQDTRWDRERAHQVLDAVPPELCTAKSTSEEVSGQQELVDFRETIKKILGFNMKTADKKIINHLRLIVQVYEAPNKSKITSGCETGQHNE
ncbi:PREDICTED: coiled-coil domain-containing protein 170-like [Ceratotherium simum simum]|uniref:Coiled-coil domain-containing protein 170-like n=1 Tax=Ceratotherium simum simum TaxID=73337 RepID=A0ABM1CJP1_CERSS|nr:PREDICTED: coiled-coil domain-containing protein 170-like [Ceratotherium simum simum]